jgi:hypothetical protein
MATGARRTVDAPSPVDTPGHGIDLLSEPAVRRALLDRLEEHVRRQYVR